MTDVATKDAVTKDAFTHLVLLEINDNAVLLESQAKQGFSVVVS